MQPEESLYWAQRSLDFAFDCGAAAVTLIPTRGGNGAMEILATRGEFVPPRLSLLESAVRYGLSLRRGRVYADLWACSEAGECAQCHTRRVEKLRTTNLRQVLADPFTCAWCGLSS